MVVYNFKTIQCVPTAKDFVDIILSKTQRKTPTVIHKHYAIPRIRQFYMRKVKYTQQNYHDRLTQILTDFPLLDDIHPFYADLVNVLYDRDHYKLALGQLNTARHLIDNIAKDYVRLLKFGDSLYRCKQLKRAALGRMATVMKKQAASLAYLEQVRQHLARLPSIDPMTRSLILCGYPNVGKSSFMNKVTRADADVQPYAFTTKSLLVGHTDYKYLRYQVLDTPGILDHPLEERNTIEMLSITALAHLRAAIVYIIDLSEECGYSIEAQVSLFESIKPLFSGKPLVVALNKTDKCTFEKLRPDASALILQLSKSENVSLLPMSTLTEEGVSGVKEYVCEKLLSMRVDAKLNTLKRDDVLGRLHVATPAPRDNKHRVPSIPQTVMEKRQQTADADMGEKPLLHSNAVDLYNKDFWKQGDDDPDWDPTVFGPDWRNQYELKEEEWKFDSIPEIIDGMNIADWIDPSILNKLRDLEKEERLRLEALEKRLESEEHFEISAEDLAAIKALREKRSLTRMEHRLTGNSKSSPMPHKIAADRAGVDEFERHLSDLGIDPSRASHRMRERSLSRGRKRTRSESRPKGMDVHASRSRTPQDEGLRDKRQKLEAQGKAWRAQKKNNKLSKKGEADRAIFDSKPKHLYSGKRGIGKTDRR
eukprot:TRINITY_DN1561_c0_g1_i1.p1 TRINITY_DN1561_c0_g1~~TRINITY_DN1561_c0_g1_i1.p1  ORF type:complete len:650 (+),score=136.96 TRINITY_DN1561_c0_g1_i1:167-2116(+)